MSYRVALALLLLPACARTGEVERDSAPSAPIAAAPEPEPEPVRVVEVPRLAPMPKDATIEFRRTGCYGPCPQYEVSVDALGQVAWNGKKDVRRLGVHAWQVSPAEVETLWQELDALSWSRLPPETYGADCPELASCNPSVEFVLRTGTETRAVSHYLGCRGNPDYDALIPLAERFDAVARTYPQSKQRK